MTTRYDTLVPSLRRLLPSCRLAGGRGSWFHRASPGHPSRCLRLGRGAQPVRAAAAGLYPSAALVPATHRPVPMSAPLPDAFQGTERSCAVSARLRRCGGTVATTPPHRSSAGQALLRHRRGASWTPLTLAPLRGTLAMTASSIFSGPTGRLLRGLSLTGANLEESLFRLVAPDAVSVHALLAIRGPEGVREAVDDAEQLRRRWSGTQACDGAAV